MHVFVTRWEIPSVSCGKSLVLFGVGPGPVLCCLLLLPEAKRKSGWGICGSSAALSFCSVFLVCFTDLPSLFYRGTTAFHCEIFNSFDTFTPILGPGLRATSAVPEEKDI